MLLCLQQTKDEFLKDRDSMSTGHMNSVPWLTELLNIVLNGHWVPSQWREPRITCCSVDLELLQRPGLTTVLLEGDGTFRKWSLVTALLDTGGVTLKEIVWPHSPPFFFSFIFYHDENAFVLPIHILLPQGNGTK